MPKRRWRDLVFLNMRRSFEMLLLGVSVVFGLGVMGACTVGGLEEDLASSAAGLLAGGLFAAVVIGAVYLFTTMSRDVRLLRRRYEDAEARRGAAREAQTKPSEQERTGA